MEFDPPVEPYSTSDKTSFAYVSARDRWPVILTGAIDDLHKAVSATEDPSRQEEGKHITKALATLKYEVQHDRRLTPLEGNGPDIEIYNHELSQRGNPKWFNVSWLYAECYLYRRLATLFSQSQRWQGYDVFSTQKTQTFHSSRSAVLELAERYVSILHTLSTQPPTLEASETLFTEILKISLWGNATDLSLLTSLSPDQLTHLQSSNHRTSSDSKILVNDSADAFVHLTSEPPGRVDIILDNAGFELFADLIFAGYLLEAGLAREVVLHPKDIPWFVSDVVPRDFAGLINALASPVWELDGKEREVLGELVGHWTKLHAEGKLVLRPNAFWTQPGSFWRMPHAERGLYGELCASGLVVFKGDLNYRKLVGDCMWEPTTGFREAIGPLKRGNVLALRTCKADVVVGLPEGKDEELRGGKKAREWAWSGEFALVQFNKGE